MKTRVFWAIGLIFLLSAGLVLAGPTLGFSSTAADRGILADIADDPSQANLGVESEGDAGELNGGGDAVRVGTLTNNLDDEMVLKSVEVESITGDADPSALTVTDPESDAKIDSGSKSGVIVECATTEKYGEETVTFSVTEATSGPVTVSGVTFTTTINLQCQSSSGGDEPTVPGDRFSLTGASTDKGVLEFELENSDDPATFSDATIELAGDAVEVDNGNNAELTDGTGGSIDFKGNNNQVWTVGDTGAIDGGSAVVTDARTTFTIQELQDGTGSPVSLDGETVEITLGYTDDSGSYDQTIEMSFASQSDGTAVVEEGETVDGDIDADEVVLSDRATAEGSVTANNGDVTAGEDTQTKGTVEASGNIEAGSGLVAKESIDAGGDVVLGGGSTVDQDITAGGSVELLTDTNVEGETVLKGSINASGDVVLGAGVEIKGDVTTDGTVYKGCDVVISGTVEAENEVDDC